MDGYVRTGLTDASQLCNMQAVWSAANKRSDGDNYIMVVDHCTIFLQIHDTETMSEIINILQANSAGQWITIQVISSSSHNFYSTEF